LKTNIFAVCDYARDEHGKLFIIGTFDSINLKEIPSYAPLFSIVLRLKLDESEFKEKFKLVIQAINSKKVNLFDPIKTEINTNIESTKEYHFMNFIFNIPMIEIKEANRYRIVLTINDTKMDEIPLEFNNVS
jgi:hypothetical protein